MKPLVALMVAGAFLTGCGSDPKRPVGSHAATLRVQQELVGNSLYVEGSYSYVRAEREGHEAVQVQLTDARTPRATMRLEPGSYELVSFQRPCDGNCSMLDPPTDRCTRALEATADAILEATVRLSPGRGCTIETRVVGA